jgi:hypothetical protein
MLAVVVAAGAVTGSETQTAARRLLFIGNSLTAWNDLPDVVARLAMVDGQPAPSVRTIAVGGFSLEDHWHQGDAQRAIAAGGWDVVVLQQGPLCAPRVAAPAGGGHASIQ